MPRAKKETTTEVKAPKKTTKGLTIDVMDMNGKSSGTVELPKEMFGAKINPVLMAQAVRVYLANQRQGTASTKGQGDVVASTRKIYRQKGTGRARHGAISAHIFVGGGVAHGPHPRDFSLKLPQKMRRAALFSALTQKLEDKAVVVFAPETNGKTREMADTLKALNMVNKKGKGNNVLLVVDNDHDTVKKAVRNIEGLDTTSVRTLSTYEVLQHKHILFVKDTVSKLEEVYIKKA